MKEDDGEIPPNKEILVQTPIIDANDQYIVEFPEESKEHGKILPDASMKGRNEKLNENYTWFQNSVDCISKWSKAMKMGIGKSVGLDSHCAAQRNSKENDSLSFSFFL